MKPTRPACRRRAAIAFALLATLVLGMAPSPPVAPGSPIGEGETAVAKKKKKPCQFRKTAALWILKKDCETKRTITVPDGVTLDGDGNVIKLAGSVLNYENIGGFYSIGILVRSGTGTVRNLTVEPRAVCRDDHAVFGHLWAIAFHDASGRVENTTIAGSGTNPTCRNGVRAAATVGSGGETVDLDGITYVSDITGPTAISYLGQVSGTVAGSEVYGPVVGVSVASGATPTIDGNTVLGLSGVVVSGVSTVATVRDNTIRGKGTQFGTGVEFYDGAAGEVADNAISNFLADGACAIRIGPDAGDVTLGTNTFPKPGNDQDVCDESAALTVRGNHAPSAPTVGGRYFRRLQPDVRESDKKRR